MDEHGIGGEIYDMHLVLRLDDPDEARVAEAIWDAGPRKGKAFVCRCILRAIDAPKKTSTEESVRELHRRVRLLEQICAKGTPIDQTPKNSPPAHSVIPAGILDQMRKYNGS